MESCRCFDFCKGVVLKDKDASKGLKNHFGSQLRAENSYAVQCRRTQSFWRTMSTLDCWMRKFISVPHTGQHYLPANSVRMRFMPALSALSNWLFMPWPTLPKNFAKRWQSGIPSKSDQSFKHNFEIIVSLNLGKRTNT